MDNNDLVEFSKIMYGMAENFSATVTENRLDLRFELLKDYSINQIEAAALKIVRTRKYTKMPTIADFVEAIEGPQENIDDDRAELQAMAVINEIRRVGSWGTPRFKDPVTAEIVKRRFGWQSLCEMPTDKTSFFVREFKSAYLSFDREEKRKHLELGMKIDPEVKRLTDSIIKSTNNK